MRYAVLGLVTVGVAVGIYVWMQEPDMPVAAPYPTDATTLAEGQEMAEIMCGLCHATGTSDPSPMADAPAFRDISKLYPVEYLEESLAEGIVAGHDQMPEIEFSPEEIDAFLGYLISIQTQ